MYHFVHLVQLSELRKLCKLQTISQATHVWNFDFHSFLTWNASKWLSRYSCFFGMEATDSYHLFHFQSFFIWAIFLDLSVCWKQTLGFVGHAYFTGQMPFLSLDQRRQSSEWNYSYLTYLKGTDPTKITVLLPVTLTNTRDLTIFNFFDTRHLPSIIHWSLTAASTKCTTSFATFDCHYYCVPFLPNVF